VEQLHFFCRPKTKADLVIIPDAPAFWSELPVVEQEKCLNLRQSRLKSLWSRNFTDFRSALASLPEKPKVILELDQPRVTFSDGSLGACREIEGALRCFIPWKKGPFEIFGHKIDAEWRSDWKWQRLLGRVGSLAGARVCDIGCNNGYYMFRMAAMNPKFVLGLEPYAKHWFTFQLLNHYAQLKQLYFELLGVEHMSLFPNAFDVVFCLGILYHHKDPVSLLEGIRRSLRKKGRLFIDCQGIAGHAPMALIPGPRYAGARGIWYLPTLPGLKNWLRRAGFQQVSVIFQEKLSMDEQRSTPWAPIDSLRQFLDPNDPEKTIEGYPAPYRFYLEVRV
jgi:tRNA (mo5U34)-methyltransferase